MTKIESLRSAASDELLWFAVTLADEAMPLRMALFRVDGPKVLLEKLWDYPFSSIRPNVSTDFLRPNRLLLKSGSGLNQLFDLRTFRELGRPSVFVRNGRHSIALGRMGPAETERVELLGRHGHLLSVESPVGSLLISRPHRESYLWREHGKVLEAFGLARPRPRPILEVCDAATGVPRACVEGDHGPSAGSMGVMAADPAGERLALISYPAGRTALEVWPIPPRVPWALILGAALLTGLLVFALLRGWARRRRRTPPAEA